MSIVETGSASYINTFEARILFEDDLDRVSRKTFRERMAEICNGRHLVRNTHFLLNFRVHEQYQLFLILSLCMPSFDPLNSHPNMIAK